MRGAITTLLVAVTLVFNGCTNGTAANLITDSVAVSGATAEDLRCEYHTNPLGIDVLRPRLSWATKSDRRGWRQIAYQILAAGSAEKLSRDKGDLWDSGRVESDKSVHVVYAGRELTSRMRCYWKVRTWDKDGKVSEYSKPAWWEMGLLKSDDWQGKWIGAAVPDDDSLAARPSPFFRRAFTLPKPVKKARAYICGLGYYELYINGEKTGDHTLDPALTRYDRRVLYVTYDVTGLLTKGANAVGVILGNGWYNMHTQAAWRFNKAPWRQRPAVICRLEIQFVDGSSTTVVTDSTWKVAAGPIVFDGIRQGETYDARLERPGWSTASYDDGKWDKARIVPGPRGKLTAQMIPPIKVTRTIKPVKVTEPKPGVFVFDLGQNIAGRAQLTVAGPAGTKVVMKYSERIEEGGMIYQKPIATYVKPENTFQTDTYILKGEGIETWEPRFVYHGFRYVEVTGFPGRPGLDSLKGRLVHTSFECAGSFECSNELFNRIQQNTLWSYVGNFHGYPTDCPHREKNGWTGDAQIAAEQAMYNFAPAAAYTKWLTDFRDEQRDSGELPGIIPTSGWGYGYYGAPAWSSASAIIPWCMYQYYGDTRILADNYELMKKYVDYLGSTAKEYIVDYGLGDWCPPGGNRNMKCPTSVTSTGYYYTDALIVSKAAGILGRTGDAEKYGKLAEKIRQAFNGRFYKGKGLYANGCQTALSCAVYQGLVDSKQKSSVIEQLAANVRRHNGHLDTGILGAKYLFHTLTENGRVDVAYRIATQTTPPSYGHWIKQGATTLWESWSGRSSRNHIFYGDISAWFYKALAGINIDPAQPGFRHIIIRPRPVGDLKWVKADHESMYGTIKSAWHRENDAFTLEVTIPANTTATVYVPAENTDAVTEGGRTAAGAEGVRFLRSEAGCAVFEAGSGRYRFVSDLVAE